MDQVMEKGAESSDRAFRCVRASLMRKSVP